MDQLNFAQCFAGTFRNLVIRPGRIWSTRWESGVETIALRPVLIVPRCLAVKGVFTQWVFFWKPNFNISQRLISPFIQKFRRQDAEGKIFGVHLTPVKRYSDSFNYEFEELGQRRLQSHWIFDIWFVVRCPGLWYELLQHCQSRRRRRHEQIGGFHRNHKRRWLHPIFFTRLLQILN